MKCIEYYRQHGGFVDRVRDDDAAKEVEAGRAFYVAKRAWKKQRDKEMEVVEE
jgi:hypothetical protein